MNSVEASGGTRGQRELAEEVAYFCIGELMPRLRTLDIVIELKKCWEDDAEAFCYPTENGVNDACRDFCIEIDHRMYKPYSKGISKKIQAERYECFVTGVCHEMVHVWQWATKLISDRIQPKEIGYRQRWKGVDIPEDTPYSKLPWERQAYRMQEVLYEKYKKVKKALDKSNYKC